MAGAAERLLAGNADRRTLPRSELSLGVTLHEPGGAQVIPAAIVNLSPTGLLAEIAEGTALPGTIEVELPNAGRRKAQIVWTNGRLAGCNFAVPLSRADMSAARLKSDFRAAEETVEALQLDPADPIWDVSAEPRSGEKWSPRKRMALIVLAGGLPWLSFAGIAALLV